MIGSSVSDVSSTADTLPATAHGDAPAEDPADGDPMVGTMIGSYRVESLLGSGGMGSVYRGVHPRIGTQVAIKVLHASLARSSTVVERFEREARASGAIGSPYIPKFYDFGTLPDGCAYAILDYYAGESVADRLERGPLPLALTKVLLAQAAKALGDAHRQGIIHRDVKPDNLFIVRDPDGGESVRVLDFGIAKVTQDRDLTHAGVFLGTPHYCAPEQLQAAEPSPAMDVYALGSTAYEMLTGRLPFDGELRTLMHRKLSGESPAVDALDPLPGTVRDTILKAIANDPAERYADMDEFGSALSTWTTQSAPSSRSTSKLALFAALAILLTTLLVLFVVLREDASDGARPNAPVIQPTREPVREAMRAEPVSTAMAVVTTAMAVMTETSPAMTMDESAAAPTMARPRRTPRARMDEPRTEMQPAEWVGWETE